MPVAAAAGTLLAVAVAARHAAATALAALTWLWLAAVVVGVAAVVAAIDRRRARWGQRACGGMTRGRSAGNAVVVHIRWKLIWC